MIKGIDVSGWQGPTPDYDGHDIVFVKASEGHSARNDHLHQQTAKARAAGKRIGFYHYSWVNQAPEGEVANLAAAVAPLIRPGDVLCLDWEWTPAQGTVTRERVNQYKREWFRLARGLFPGHRVILYTNTDRWLRWDQDSECGDGLWIAHYGVPAGQPGIRHPWIGHQWTDSPVDQSVWRFPDLAAWDEWAGIPDTEPDPPTPPPAIPPAEDRLERLEQLVIRHGHTITTQADLLRHLAQQVDALTDMAEAAPPRYRIAGIEDLRPSHG